MEIKEGLCFFYQTNSTKHFNCFSSLYFKFSMKLRKNFFNQKKKNQINIILISSLYCWERSMKKSSKNNQTQIRSTFFLSPWSYKMVLTCVSSLLRWISRRLNKSSLSPWTAVMVLSVTMQNSTVYHLSPNIQNFDQNTP